MRSATPWSDVVAYLVEATGETLYMVGVSTVIATVLGIPVGVWLQLTAKGGLRPNTTTGSPTSVAPATSSVPPLSEAMYHSDGICNARCGSFASSAAPFAPYFPETTQALLPT